MSFWFRSHGGTGLKITGHDHAAGDNPAGGHAVDQEGCPYGDARFRIRWQDGPVNREAGEIPNGAFVEDVLEVCNRRLKFYQDSRFACPENAEAIEHIEKGLEALLRRRGDRKARGVLGKNEI